MTTGHTTSIISIWVVSLCVIVVGLNLHASAMSPVETTVDQVSKMENRFFFKQYVNDPVEKRLQRLELLVFGSTQGGNNEERAARLKKAILERDNKAGASTSQTAAKQSGQHPVTPSNRANGNRPPSANYPILNTLEWRVFKRTYPEEALDQRLERLEVKLFGQSSPAMAYVDRVDRLKRTIGIDVAQSKPSGPLGPMPKARPRQFDQGDDGYRFGSPATPNLLPPEAFGFRTIPGMPQGFSEMFKELDRTMEELMRMPPGQYQWDPKSGGLINPDGSPKGRVPDADKIKEKTQPAVPPYYDPNSI